MDEWNGPPLTDAMPNLDGLLVGFLCNVVTGCFTKSEPLSPPKVWYVKYVMHNQEDNFSRKTLLLYIKKAVSKLGFTNFSLRYEESNTFLDNCIDCFKCSYDSWCSPCISAHVLFTKNPYKDITLVDKDGNEFQQQKSICCWIDCGKKTVKEKVIIEVGHIFASKDFITDIADTELLQEDKTKPITTILSKVSDPFITKPEILSGGVSIQPITQQPGSTVSR